MIQEETESQMSSDSEQDFDSYSEFYPSSSHQRKQRKTKEPDHFGIHDFTDNPSPENNIMGLSPNSAIDGPNDEVFSDEIIMKHIRISPSWDPVSPQIFFYHDLGKAVTDLIYLSFISSAGANTKTPLCNY